MTTKRNLTVNFTRPYARAGYILIANSKLAQEKGIAGLADLNREDITIASRRGSTGAVAMARHFPKARKNFFDDDVLSVQEVANGNIEAASSTCITLVRMALWKKYGHNVSFQGGDSEWVQVPAPSIPAALASDQIDAGTLIHAQAYKAMKSGEFRSIVPAAKDNVEIFGIPTVAAVYVGYPDKPALPCPHQ